MAESTHSMRLAKPTDLPYVQKLQRVWSNQIGFLPKPALERYINNQATLLVQQNGQHAGYLSWQLTRKGLLRLMQLAIDPELLRGRLGTDILQHIERAARKGSCSVVRFQTRIDLDANLFFDDQGYKTTAVFQHPTARRRPLIEWTKCLLDPSILAHALLVRSKRYQRRTQFPQPRIVLPQSSI